MSLLKETLSALNSGGKGPADVLWVGWDGDKRCGWYDFAQVANDIDYDSGFGTAEINQSLVVVGEDWWLSRGEYDGSEWWSFNRKPGTEKVEPATLTVTDVKPTRNW